MHCNCKSYIWMSLKEKKRQSMLKAVLVKYTYTRVLHTVVCYGVSRHPLCLHCESAQIWLRYLQQTSFWLVCTLQKNTATVHGSLYQELLVKDKHLHKTFSGISNLLMQGQKYICKKNEYVLVNISCKICFKCLYLRVKCNIQLKSMNQC